MRLSARCFLLLAICCLAAFPAAAGDNAAFVYQDVPTSLSPGEVRTVTVVMQNNGTTTWTRNGDYGYKLGSQNPQDNSLWRYGRVYLDVGESVSPGSSKLFTFTITAPSTPGTYNFQWRMLQEGVAWFGAYSQNVAITVSNHAQVTLCSGVSVIPDGMTDLGPAIQTCINNAPWGGTLNLPPGTYGIGTRVLINKPFTLQTQGLAGSTANCESTGINCAVLKALPSFNDGSGGFLAADSTQSVTFDHLILDGNRAARLNTPAASYCADGIDGHNQYGVNARMLECASCRLTNSVSKNALCATAFGFRGHDATITNNVFRLNGQNSAHLMWADGLTLNYSDRATVSNNSFVDNSDVALIMGGGRNAVVTNNLITQPGQVVFAALMLNSFNVDMSTGVWGQFSGTVVNGNTIDCFEARNCHFGIQIGDHAWAVTNTIQGGDVHGNSVSSARQGINVDGAGTPQAPLILYGNTVTNAAPGGASFLCANPPPTSSLNINTADSVVNRNGDTTSTTAYVWHNCQ